MSHGTMKQASEGIVQLEKSKRDERFNIFRKKRNQFSGRNNQINS